MVIVDSSESEDSDNADSECSTEFMDGDESDEEIEGTDDESGSDFTDDNTDDDDLEGNCEQEDDEDGDEDGDFEDCEDDMQESGESGDDMSSQMSSDSHDSSNRDSTFDKSELKPDDLNLESNERLKRLTGLKIKNSSNKSVNQDEYKHDSSDEEVIVELSRYILVLNS